MRMRKLLGFKSSEVAATSGLERRVRICNFFIGGPASALSAVRQLHSYHDRRLEDIAAKLFTASNNVAA